MTYEWKQAAMVAQKGIVKQHDADEESQKRAGQLNGEAKAKGMRIDFLRDQQDLRGEKAKNLNQRNERNKAKCDAMCRVLLLECRTLRVRADGSRLMN